jgi:acetyltransferase-like isoleucine patch superfamily enzyme
MTGFVSSKAKVKGFVEEDAVILGKTIIGLGTLVDRNVIIGYPVEKALRTLDASFKQSISSYDLLSKGATIGNECIIRSGTVVYESAILDDKVRTGHNVLIREGSVIGAETLIGSSSKLDGTVKVGNGVCIQSNVYLPHLAVINDGVFIAPNVVITNDPYPQCNKLAAVVVKKNAVICANATLLTGIEVGSNAVIGAGAVVTKNVPQDSVVVGNPAHFLMTRKEYDEKRALWLKSDSNIIGR